MVAVIGDPISHSLSPIIHNAAFGAMGLDFVSVACPVPDGSAPPAVAGVRALGLRGVSVTMPHKAAVLAELDRLTPVATALGAVNCIFRDHEDDAVLVGDNTDGEGFLRGLRADFGLDPAGARCVVLGAGGAARAVVLALAGAGVATVAVANRDAGRGRAAADLAGAKGRVLARADVAAELAAADLVVNATSVGMGTDPSAPCDTQVLHAGQIVADLVYHPLATPLVREAAVRGARSANGVSMLVHQAAVALTRWTGREAPVEAMSRAVADAFR